MNIPNEREQARAARQAALGKLERDIVRGHDIDKLAGRLSDLHDKNHFVEMIEAAMRPRETKK